MTACLVTVGVIITMEPAAALAHRIVMHGRGWRWHRSHHRRRVGRFERNDLFPVVFATATIGVLAAGTALGAPTVLAAGAGVTGYGIAYLVVHDLCLHGRLGGAPLVRGRYLGWLAAAHEVHHRFGAAPFGFLVPIVPSRHRAAVATLTVSGTRARTVNTS